jgi:hypothetical protein
LGGVVDHPQQGEERQAAVGEAHRAVGLAAGEEIVEDLLEGLALGADVAPAALALDRLALLGEHQHVVAVGDDVGDPGLEELAQLLHRRRLGGDDLARPRQQRFQQLVADRDQQVVLALDVVVEAAGGEAGRLGQLAHRGRVVAALGEQLRRRRHHLAAARFVTGAQGGAGRGRGDGHRRSR